MAKTEIDRHIDPPQISFTLLVDETDMKYIVKVGKDEVRTKGFLVREAIKEWRKRREFKR